MTLYQLETVKVPIKDENKEADSYTEVTVTKSYLASNRDYYIQLVLPELGMCKKLGELTIVRNCFWSNIKQNTVVRVPSSTT